jgi:hypothetical protein
MIEVAIVFALICGTLALILMIKRLAAKTNNARAKLLLAWTVPALFFVAVLVVPILATKLTGDPNWNVSVIAALLGTFIPLLYLDFVEYSNQIVEATQLTQKLVQRMAPLRNGLGTLVDLTLDALSHNHQLINGDQYSHLREEDRLGRTACLNIYKRNFNELCRQIGELDFHFRGGDRFPSTWAELIKDAEYQSICDLSSYSRLREAATTNFDETHGVFSQSWERRIRREVETLQQVPGTFQKILIYSKPTKYENNRLRPPCHETGRCDYERCRPEEKCLVKPIAEYWATSVSSIKAKRPSSANGKSRNSLWLLSRDHIESRIKNLNLELRDGARRLDSIDIGLFGRGFLGEEFKFALGLNREKEPMEDFLYRIRYDSSLVSDLRRIFNDLIITPQAIPADSV